MTKEQYIKRTFARIRAKGLQNPVILNKGAIVHDLERYLQTMENALRNNENRRLMKHLVSELRILENLEITQGV